MVSKVRTTVTLDEHVLKAVKVKAARMGKGESELIEEALRRDLGMDVLDRLWIVNDMTEEEATALAVEAQHETHTNR
jgi:metal-responsive CopG/Arc/MetJ family transcriptional regulator